MDTRRTERRALVALLLLTIVLVAFVVRPLAQAILLGAVLAAVLWPLQRGLARRLGGRSAVAATLLILGVIVLVLGPLTAMSAFLVQQAIEAVTFLQAVLQSEGVDSLISRLPDVLEGPVRRFVASSGAPLSQLAGGITGAVSTVRATLVATGSVAFQMVMAFVALFFFLTNKDNVLAWLTDASPLEDRQTRELMREVRLVSVSVVRSTVLTAGVQTLAAAVGYVAAGVPYWAFFTGVTFFMALIPAIGAAAVSLAVALLLLVIGKPIGALFLTIWGLVVVGLSDNLVKPLLIRHGVRMNGIVVLFALLGGLGAFGPIGLIVGPLVVSLFVAVLRIYHRDYGDGNIPGGAAAGAEPTSP